MKKGINTNHTKKGHSKMKTAKEKFTNQINKAKTKKALRKLQKVIMVYLNYALVTDDDVEALNILIDKYSKGMVAIGE